MTLGGPPLGECEWWSVRRVATSSSRKVHPDEGGMYVYHKT